MARASCVFGNWRLYKSPILTHQSYRLKVHPLCLLYPRDPLEDPLAASANREPRMDSKEYFIGRGAGPDTDPQLDAVCPAAGRVADVTGDKCETTRFDMFWREIFDIS